MRKGTTFLTMEKENTGLFFNSFRKSFYGQSSRFKHI